MRNNFPNHVHGLLQLVRSKTISEKFEYKISHLLLACLLKTP